MDVISSWYIALNLGHASIQGRQRNGCGKSHLQLHRTSPFPVEWASFHGATHLAFWTGQIIPRMLELAGPGNPKYLGTVVGTLVVPWECFCHSNEVVVSSFNSMIEVTNDGSGSSFMVFNARRCWRRTSWRRRSSLHR